MNKNLLMFFFAPDDSCPCGCAPGAGQASSDHTEEAGCCGSGHDHEETCGYHDQDCGCSDQADECTCNAEDFELDQGDMEISDDILEIQDMETGETFSFQLADSFEYKNNAYLILLEDIEEPREYYIVRQLFDEDGDYYIETLAEDEVDEIYDAYDHFLEECLEEEAEDPEETDSDEAETDWD